jgi:glucose-6-phosphate 1-dehydrogenase
VGTSLEEMDDEAFQKLATEACEKYCRHEAPEDEVKSWVQNIRYVAQGKGAGELSAVVNDQAANLDGDARLLHYLSVPPNAVIPVVETLREAGLAKNAGLVMEKPFGVDLDSAVELNASIHDTFDESQIFRIDHFLGKEAAQNILAFRFANGLFEPIWNRNFIDHVQIDVPEKLSLEGRAKFYEPIGAFKDMVVTHLFQILGFVAMEPPTALASKAISDEKNKVFSSMVPLDPKNVVRGQYRGYREEPGVSADSDADTFVALKCEIDNWRWAGVPFYLRTGKCLAEGQRIISIAFREPPKSMFPSDSGVGAQGPDHLTFDLADEFKVSLSFYGKRPGPGMKLDKHSLQFGLDETDTVTDVLEGYERLILDAMRGDHTLYTTSDGIERLWEVSQPLLDDSPQVRSYDVGSWGPNAVHQLIAPSAWRLPFDRSWRGK